MLILVARPLAAFVATALRAARHPRAGDARLGGPARRDPDLARDLPGRRRGRRAAQEVFAIVFFVVVTSTLVQGASFEPLAKRLGLTTDEPALPRRLLESGRIRAHGRRRRSPTGCAPGAAAAGHLVRELGLPARGAAST